jgi:hypothetical protein
VLTSLGIHERICEVRFVNPCRQGPRIFDFLVNRELHDLETRNVTNDISKSCFMTGDGPHRKRHLKGMFALTSGHEPQTGLETKTH